jgi:hypothetical protein
MLEQRDYIDRDEKKSKSLKRKTVCQLEQSLFWSLITPRLQYPNEDSKATLM